MRFLSIMGNSFGCSASGERLVSAARDGDLQEAKALLEYNPRLARYSTFGVRNSPLHYSAAQGHNEIVTLLIESGVDINLRNIRGQTALMQACQYGHWEVVQTLILFRANIHRMDYLNGGTALHFAALNGHTRCIRLLLADYVPSISDFWNVMRTRTGQETSTSEFDEDALVKIVNKKADGGITALHMAALNGHAETVHLLLDLGASVSEVTVEDGTTIDLIGSGSTPLHYAAYGGNAVCCQVLIAKGASLTAENANGWTSLMVARSWHRNWLEGILTRRSEGRLHALPSPYLSIPLMSIVKIAREYGWRNANLSPAVDPCVVCLERKCTVAAGGCGHEFCTRCAMYLCSTSSSMAVSGPPGSIACPLCRHAIVMFAKLQCLSPIRESPRPSLSLSLCTACPLTGSESASSMANKLWKPDFHCTRISPPSSSSLLRSLSFQKFPSMRLSPTLCMGAPDTTTCLIRCPRSRLRRSVSHGESGRRSWLFPFNQYITTTANS